GGGIRVARPSTGGAARTTSQAPMRCKRYGKTSAGSALRKCLAADVIAWPTARKATIASSALVATGSSGALKPPLGAAAAGAAATGAGAATTGAIGGGGGGGGASAGT